MEYKNIPVDKETKTKLVVLSEAMGLGKRGQGAVIRILVHEKMQTLGLSGGSVPLPVGSDDAVALPAIDDVA